MTASAAEQREPGNEHSYEEYLAAVTPYVDEKVFHPVVLAQEGYDDFVSQPSVIMSGSIPVALGVEDAGAVIEPERCKQLAGGLGVEDADNVYASILPSGVLVENLPQLIGQLANQPGEKIIFSQIDIVDDESEQKFQKSLLPFGITLHNLEHPRLHSPASYSLFEMVIEADVSADKEARTASEAIEKNEVPIVQTKDGRMVIERGDRLDDETLNQLWQLYSSRFTDISDNFPDRLEESEDSTEEIMTNPAYNFIYKKDDEGYITACIFFTDDESAYPWINPHFIDHRQAALKKENQPEPYSIFIPGIAAERSGRGSTAAAEVSAQLMQVLASTNQPRLVGRFECTDVSSRYVPAVSLRAARQQEKFKDMSIEQVGLLKFVALKVPAPEV